MKNTFCKVITVGEFQMLAMIKFNTPPGKHIVEITTRAENHSAEPFCPEEFATFPEAQNFVINFNKTQAEMYLKKAMQSLALNNSMNLKAVKGKA